MEQKPSEFLEEQSSMQPAVGCAAGRSVVQPITGEEIEEETCLYNQFRQNFPDFDTWRTNVPPEHKAMWFEAGDIPSDQAELDKVRAQYQAILEFKYKEYLETQAPQLFHRLQALKYQESKSHLNDQGKEGVEEKNLEAGIQHVMEQSESKKVVDPLAVVLAAEPMGVDVAVEEVERIKRLSEESNRFLFKRNEMTTYGGMIAWMCTACCRPKESFLGLTLPGPECKKPIDWLDPLIGSAGFLLGGINVKSCALSYTMFGALGKVFTQWDPEFPGGAFAPCGTFCKRHPASEWGGDGWCVAKDYVFPAQEKP